MKIHYYFAVLLYCGFIFWMSGQSHPPEPEFEFPGKDKVAHIVLYGGLAALVSIGIRRRGYPASPTVQFWVPVVFAALYGVSDEIHQSFTPMRNVDPWDIVANTAGALLVQGVLCRLIWRIWQGKPTPDAH